MRKPMVHMIPIGYISKPVLALNFFEKGDAKRLQVPLKKDSVALEISAALIQKTMQVSDLIRAKRDFDSSISILFSRA